TDLAARRRDAPKRLSHRLDRYGHVVCIGVDERRAVTGDRDVALPEHQIAAAQFGKGRWLAELAFLHVAVARAWDARCLQCHLHQRRAVEAQRRLAAPEIRRAEELLGDRDEIALL